MRQMRSSYRLSARQRHLIVAKLGRPFEDEKEEAVGSLQSYIRQERDSSMVKSLQDCQIFQNCQKLPNLSTIVKIVKKNSQNSYRVIFWVRSCLLITLIKCLKGHKSLGLLLKGIL